MVRRWLVLLSAVLLLPIPAWGATDGPLVVTWQLPEPAAWEREQLRLLVTVQSPERYASLRLPSWQADGFEVVPIPPRRHHPREGGSRLEAGWLLFPLAAGSRRLAAPPIEYRLGGRSERLLAPPLRQVEVRALPEWMTPEIPVGRPRISARLIAPPWPSTDELMRLEISMEGEAIHPAWLPSVDSLLPPVAGLRLLPAREWRSSEPSPQGIHGLRRLHIPLRMERSGILPLPTLRLPWFDPGSGRLQVATAEPPRPWVIGPVWRLSFGLCLLALALLARGPLSRARISLARWHARRRLIRMLEGASDYQEVLEQVRCHAAAEGWHGRATLGRWMEAMERRFGPDPLLRGAVEEILAARFGRGERETAPHLPPLIAALRRRFRSPFR